MVKPGGKINLTASHFAWCQPLMNTLNLAMKTPNTLIWEAQLAFLGYASSKVPHVAVF